MPIKVLVVDDHAVVRDGLKRILEAESDMRVVAEAATGPEAVRLAREQRPDVVVMDIAIPELDGLEAAARIARESKHARVVVLSIHGTSEHVRRAMKAGVKAYVLKECAGTEVVAAVRAAHAGRRYFSERVSDLMAESLAVDARRTAHEDSLDTLSSREREVLQLVAEGKSSRRIADLLHISPKTVDTYRSRLMRKLDVQSLADMVRFAVKRGLIPVE